jgi:anti-anti-sigma factor
VTTQPTDPPAFHIASFLVCPPGLTLVSPVTGAGHHDHIVRVQVVGELDIATAPALSAELVDVARGHALRASWAAQPTIELDLAGLTFLDSSGLVALSDSYHALRELGCGLCLTDPQPEVLRLLDCAISHGWLPADVQSADNHPWPPVTYPIRARAIAPRPVPLASWPA